MKRCQSSLYKVAAILVCCGCGGGASKELREFEKLEAALGMIASARPEDRVIRLEQLENLRVVSERVLALKGLCTSSYQSFDRASRHLEQAKRRIAGVEQEINKAAAKKQSGTPLDPEEEARLLRLSKEAMTALQTVTRSLDEAQKLVDACEKKRMAMRRELLSE